MSPLQRMDHSCQCFFVTTWPRGDSREASIWIFSFKPHTPGYVWTLPCPMQSCPPNVNLMSQTKTGCNDQDSKTLWIYHELVWKSYFLHNFFPGKHHIQGIALSSSYRTNRGIASQCCTLRLTQFKYTQIPLLPCGALMALPAHYNPGVFSFLVYKFATSFNFLRSSLVSSTLFHLCRLSRPYSGECWRL